nr:unnamed protein product [Callosobruchus analis]
MVIPICATFKGKDRYLPFNTWTTFNLDVNLYFYGLLIYQVLTVTMSGMNNSGIDIVCYKLSSIVCCQLDLFVRRSAQLDYKKRSIIVPLLKNLTKHHYEIDHLAQTLNELLSPISFIQCISSGLAICFVGFQLMVVVSIYSKMMSNPGLRHSLVEQSNGK